MLVKLFTHYCESTDTNYHGSEASSKQTSKHSLDCDSVKRLTANNDILDDMYNDVFGTISKSEDDIYPPTIADISSEQREEKQYKRYT